MPSASPCCSQVSQSKCHLLSLNSLSLSFSESRNTPTTTRTIWRPLSNGVCFHTRQLNSPTNLTASHRLCLHWLHSFLDRGSTTFLPKEPSGPQGLSTARNEDKHEFALTRLEVFLCSSLAQEHWPLTVQIENVHIHTHFSTNTKTYFLISYAFILSPLVLCLLLCDHLENAPGPDFEPHGPDIAILVGTWSSRLESRT